MSEHKIKCTWQKDMQFEAKDLKDHKVLMDISEDHGGHDQGFYPMPMLLVSLSGCMGVDFKIVLDRMRISLDQLEIETLGTLDTNVSPKVYKKIVMNFYCYGKNLKEHKIKDAIRIAKNDMCNVSAMLSQICTIEYNAILKES